MGASATRQNPSQKLMPNYPHIGHTPGVSNAVVRNALNVGRKVFKNLCFHTLQPPPPPAATSQNPQVFHWNAPPQNRSGYIQMPAVLPSLWLKIFSKVTSPIFSMYLCITLRTLQAESLSYNRIRLTKVAMVIDPAELRAKYSMEYIAVIRALAEWQCRFRIWA